jgi:hypothetical protein
VPGRANRRTKDRCCVSRSRLLLRTADSQDKVASWNQYPHSLPDFKESDGYGRVIPNSGRDEDFLFENLETVVAELGLRNEALNSAEGDST